MDNTGATAFLDRIIQEMMKYRADHTILVNDQPIRLCKNTKELKSGARVSMSQLRGIAEGIEVNCQKYRGADGCEVFRYQSAYGAYDISINDINGFFMVGITPADLQAVVAAAPQAKTSNIATAPKQPTKPAPTITNIQHEEIPKVELSAGTKLIGIICGAFAFIMLPQFLLQQGLPFFLVLMITVIAFIIWCVMCFG